MRKKIQFGLLPRGGVSEGSKKAKCFLEKRIFQKLFGTSLGPPKHVLHLVWSVWGISTAIKKALKVPLYDFFDGPLAPLNGQFMEKVNHYNRTKHKEFLMGPSVKFVLAIIDSFSKKIWT